VNEPAPAPQLRTWHDRIFKEFLHRFLPEFLKLFFSKEAAQLNFDTLSFIEQELIINLPNQTLRITDVVAEVETHAGQPEVIIVHVEVEASDRKPLPRRMSEYYALLRVLRQKPVLPIALVLVPTADGLTWQTYRESLFDRDLLRFRYGQVGIRDLPGEDYVATGNPVAAALAALMQPGEQSRAEIKLNALRTVIASGLTDPDKLFLINVVERYLPTSEIFDAQEEIMQELADMETTWVERALQEGREEGREEGKEEGMRRLLLHLLSVRFGPLPAEFVERLNAVTDEETLNAISEQVLSADTLAAITFPGDVENVSNE
jgi:hypothetical protein